MPWTLYRYLLMDLLRLLALSTTVLVMVVSFAAAIRPIQEGMLTPWLLIKFIGYSIPTMLGFVLPLTSAFASTLVFLRMASDNEIVACSASGMSYRKVLFPVAALGITLTLGMFYLANFVVPSFYRAAEETTRSDLVTLLVNQVKNNRPFEQGDWALYADQVEQMTAEEARADLETQRDAGNAGAQAMLDWMDGLTLEDLTMGEGVPPTQGGPRNVIEQIIQFSGVGVVEIADENELALASGQVVTRDMTAAVATAVVYGQLGAGEIWVRIRLQDTMYLDAQGAFGNQTTAELPPLRVPTRLADNLKFFSLPELDRLSRDRTGYEPIRRFQVELAQALAIRAVRQKIQQAIRSNQDGYFTLVRRDEQGEIVEVYEIVAPGPGQGSNRGLTFERMFVGSQERRPVVTAYGDDHEADYQWKPRTLFIEVKGDEQQIEPVISLEIADPWVQRVGEDQSPNELDSLMIHGLSWPEPLLTSEDGTQAGVLEPANLLRILKEKKWTSQAIRRAQGRMETQLEQLGSKIVAEKNERAATSINCALVLLMGTLMAIRSKGQMPLVVYFWSFLLAITSTLIISTGANMAGSHTHSLGTGLAIMWGGDGLLLFVAITQYRKLTKH